MISRRRCDVDRGCEEVRCKLDSIKPVDFKSYGANATKSKEDLNQNSVLRKEEQSYGGRDG